jgi:hypothetical protein
VDRNGNDLGVIIYQAYSAEFGMVRPKGPNKAYLALTVDLRAKLLRSQSLLDVLYEGRDRKTKLSPKEQDQAKRMWIGETVIYTIDKKTYSVVGFKFDHSAATLPVDGLLIDGKPCSHAQYFKVRKGKALQYPDATPMVEVLGKRKQHIFLPAELICGNELDRRVKELLPTIASYRPHERNEAIDKIKKFLQPGAQKTRGAGGLLPAIGITMKEDRLQAKATVMPVPMLMAAGVQIPKDKCRFVAGVFTSRVVLCIRSSISCLLACFLSTAENWGPVLARANFNVESNRYDICLAFPRFRTKVM